MMQPALLTAFLFATLLVDPATSKPTFSKDDSPTQLTHEELVSTVEAAYLKPRFTQFDAVLTMKNGKKPLQTITYKSVMSPDREIRVDVLENDVLLYTVQTFRDMGRERHVMWARETDVVKKVSYEPYTIDPKAVRLVYANKILNKDQRCALGFFLASFTGSKSYMISYHLPTMKAGKLIVPVVKKDGEQAEVAQILHSRESRSQFGKTSQKQNLFTIRLADGALVEWELRTHELDPSSLLKEDDVHVINQVKFSNVKFVDELDKGIFKNSPF